MSVAVLQVFVRVASWSISASCGCRLQSIWLEMKKKKIKVNNLEAILKHERGVQWYRLRSELLVGLLRIAMKSYAIELALNESGKNV